MRKKSVNHKYLVCSIYGDQFSSGGITRIENVKIVMAASPFSAKVMVKKQHKPKGVKPTTYVASLILGPFKINAFSHQMYSCEDLLTVG